MIREQSFDFYVGVNDSFQVGWFLHRVVLCYFIEFDAFFEIEIVLLRMLALKIARIKKKKNLNLELALLLIGS